MSRYSTHNDQVTYSLYQSHNVSLLHNIQSCTHAHHFIQPKVRKLLHMNCVCQDQTAMIMSLLFSRASYSQCSTVEPCLKQIPLNSGHLRYTYNFETPDYPSIHFNTSFSRSQLAICKQFHKADP